MGQENGSDARQSTSEPSDGFRTSRDGLGPAKLDLPLRESSLIGGRTLEVLAQTERLNEWLYSKLANAVRGDVLEIGSGIGNLSRLILRSADHAVLTDVEPRYLELLRTRYAGNPKVTVAEYDLDAPPPSEVAARGYDAIVAVNVIEHIEDDVGLVRRLGALLNPGGHLLVYVPACPFAYGTMDAALGHFRRYTPESLRALLREAGLVSPTPRYFNLLGLLGWLFNGWALRREHLPARQMALFDSLVPVVRLEDRFRLPVGLAVYTHARKPTNGVPG
jgi:SAM-dependent methyltransferase